MWQWNRTEWWNSNQLQISTFVPKGKNPAAPGSRLSFLLSCSKSNLSVVCTAPQYCLFKANSYESKAAFSSLRNKKVKINMTNFAFLKSPRCPVEGPPTHSHLYSPCETFAEAPEGPCRVVDARWRDAPQLRGPGSCLWQGRRNRS